MEEDFSSISSTDIENVENGGYLHFEFLSGRVLNPKVFSLIF